VSKKGKGHVASAAPGPEGVPEGFEPHTRRSGLSPEVIRIGSSLCFASALVLANDSVCARASGVFKVVSV
jgi:hypothetical protein